MRKFRLIGLVSLIGIDGTIWAQAEQSMIIHAHSSLDAGARWKGDPEFYNIGELQFIEDLGYGTIRKPSVRAYSAEAKKQKPKPTLTRIEETEVESAKRRKNARATFSFQNASFA
jgi:hypothetical protein